MEFQIHLLRALMLGVTVTFLFEKGAPAPRYRRLLVLALLVLFAAASTQTMLGRQRGRFWQNGFVPPPSHYMALRQWYESTGMRAAETILLTTNELSFAVHGFTGAKLLTGRNAHFYLFDDEDSGFQELWMDAALILYGKGSLNRREIIRRYADKAGARGMRLYLYWNENWTGSEWIEAKGRRRPFDPLRFEYSEQRAARLAEGGVAYEIVEDAVFEPSVGRRSFAPRMTLIYVTPENYRSFDRPWREGLDPFLKEVWSFERGGRTEARLYEVLLPR